MSIAARNSHLNLSGNVTSPIKISLKFQEAGKFSVTKIHMAFLFHEFISVSLTIQHKLEERLGHILFIKLSEYISSETQKCSLHLLKDKRSQMSDANCVSRVEEHELGNNIVGQICKWPIAQNQNKKFLQIQENCRCFFSFFFFFSVNLSLASVITMLEIVLFIPYSLRFGVV